MTMTQTCDFTRRGLIAGLTAAAGLTLVGCGRSGKPNDNDAGASQPAATLAPAVATTMVVYRDPSCGCCKAWAAIARKAGYQVNVVDRPDMTAIKQKYGVPAELRSCHTTVVEGYAVEGHVPLEHVRRLLNDKPAGVRGIAVAGMPLGSPGMEVPDGTKQPFQVMAFEASGRTSVFKA
jgi:hypothetical protein